MHGAVEMNLKVAKDASEIISYENVSLPAYISRGRLSHFSNMKALGHWHDDIEIMLALDGNFSYDVNGKKFFVREGNAIVVNSQQMHYGYSADGADGEYLCVLFQPHILTASNFIAEKYIAPIVRHPYITETFLRRDNENHRAVLSAIDKFLAVPKIDGHELAFMSIALNFWKSWFELLNAALKIIRQSNVVAVDLLELSPPYDSSGISTATALKILREIILALSVL